MLKTAQIFVSHCLLLMGVTFGTTAKDYSGPNDTSTTWLAGGRIDEHTLGRGAQINYAYTADQFLDLWKIDYPALNSGPFSVSSITEEFGYDTAGRINSISDQSGTRDLDYEKDRLVETDYTGGALNPYTVKRLYADGVGRQTGLVVERDGVAIHSATYSYSGDSSELAQVVSGGITSVFERDGGAATGPRLLTRVTRGAVQQQYTRDTNAGGRITHANSNGTTSAPTFHYSDFDSHGRRETCATSNGSWDWDYSDGQLQSASNATLGTFQYTYDASGRRTGYQVPGSGLLNPSLNDLGQFQTLPRDQQYSLFIEAAAGAELWINGQQMPSPTFPFYFEKTTGFPSGGGWEHWDLLAVLPGAGDPGAAPDAKSELEGYVWIPPLSESMTHDGDGNRQSSAQWDYGWDGRNRLVAARSKDYLTAAKGWDLEFDYDAEGRRFKKVVRCYESGQLVEDKTITFVWDGWDLVYERHEDGNQELLLERKYAWGLDISGTRGGAGGAGGLLAIEETRWSGASSNTITALPLYDGSGHVVGLADAAGDLVAEYWWGPFGELIEASGPMANSNPWRYATKYHDVETGLSYFGHRYYDPVTGQWLSREPLGEGENLNLYALCHNDPINKVDVLGLAEYPINALTNFHGLTSGAFEGFPASLQEKLFKMFMQKKGLTGRFDGEQYFPSEAERGRYYAGVEGATETGAILNDYVSILRRGQEFDQAFTSLVAGQRADRILGNLNSEFAGRDQYLGQVWNKEHPQLNPGLAMIPLVEAGWHASNGDLDKAFEATLWDAALLPLAVTGRGIRGARNVDNIADWYRMTAPRATLRSGGGIDRIALSRTRGLGTTSTTDDLLASGAIPGMEGVILNQGTVKFADIWAMSHRSGVEFALTREGGRYVLRSGAATRVSIPRGVRPIVHTHPTNAFGVNSLHPSRADINTLNYLWGLNPNGVRPVSQIITGPSATTIFRATGINLLP